MKILRTPDDRFENLPDFPYEPNYIELEDVRIHYVDEGPADGEVVLMMHGEPSWSYLYRHMIPLFVEAGYRVIAPDLVGFGRSDKPAEQSDYSYQRHVDWMWAWLQAVGLEEITLVCQDWGSLIGLRFVAEHPELFKRVALANGGLPTGDQGTSRAFDVWREFSIKTKKFPVGGTIDRGIVSSLSDEVKAAYDAPFPDESYKAGARIFPTLVPITGDDPASEANRDAWKALRKFEKPFLTAFSDQDPITRGADKRFLKHVPGASGQPHTTITDAGHFLQEEKGPELAKVILDFMDRTPG